MSTGDRELAEKHWEYTFKILKVVIDFMLAVCHLLYVEAMVHGIKHGRTDK